MPQLGRNDPCWCGSGKKYKNCHLTQDQRAESRELVKTNLIQRLDEYAIQLEEDFKAATKFYFGTEKDFAEGDDEQAFQFYTALDYFVHDYRLANDQRVIERFLAEHGKRLSADERALLNDWRHSRFAAFEVLDVQRDQGLRVRDLVSGEEFDVREKRGSQSVHRWDVVVTRLLRVWDHYEFGGYAFHVPAHFRGWVRGYLDGLWDDYRFKHPETTYEDFLHASSQLLVQFIMNEVEPAMSQPPTLVTMEGDLTEFCAATFDVMDYTMALAELRAAAEFVEEKPDATGEERVFAWFENDTSLALLRAHGPDFEYKPPADAALGGGRVLGHLTLSRDELRLQVTSQRRLDAGKELLAQRLGSAIQHRADEFKSVEEMLAQMLARAPAEESEEELPEELEAFQAEMAARYHREWLDQKIPALDDLTPREAVKTLGGRVRVIRLLKEFEEAEDRKAQAGEIVYDLSELKKELGLSDQEFLDESRLEDRIKEELEQITDLARAARVDDALAAWRALRAKYAIASVDDFEFAEVWDLGAILDETLTELADALALAQRYAEGIALLEEYRALDPDDLDALRTDIAEMRVECGQVEAGLRELQTLFEEIPEDFEVGATLAYIQSNFLNRPDDALATLQRAREFAEDEAADAELTDEMLETYLRFRRLDEAEHFWHQENDAVADDARNWYAWTRIMLARSDVACAREGAQKIQDEVTRAYWLGMVEARARNFDAARKWWADNLKEPADADSLLWIEWMELHLRLCEFDRVIQKIDPTALHATALAHFYLALAHAAKGDLNRATEYARAGHAEAERRMRRGDRLFTLRQVRDLAEELELSDAARRALEIASKELQ